MANPKERPLPFDKSEIIKVALSNGFIGNEIDFDEDGITEPNPYLTPPQLKRYSYSCERCQVVCQPDCFLNEDAYDEDPFNKS